MYVPKVYVQAEVTIEDGQHLPAGLIRVHGIDSDGVGGMMTFTREAADSIWRSIANELEAEEQSAPTRERSRGGHQRDERWWWPTEKAAIVLQFPTAQVDKARRVAHYRALASEAAGIVRSSFYDQDAPANA